MKGQWKSMKIKLEGTMKVNEDKTWSKGQWKSMKIKPEVRDNESQWR
jgi:hypothetical protein